MGWTPPKKASGRGRSGTVIAPAANYSGGIAVAIAAI
jgi:protein-tyrosine phosphatase|tara:strand:+ start:9166 stop:9276 length:111 start_codon:yes stop_codon:yes gene_type:complete